MGFPIAQLNDNEEMILDLRPHWWFCIRPALAIILAAVALATSAAKGAPAVVQQFGGACLLLAVLWLGARLIRWVTTNFVVTTERLIHRSGVLARHEVIISLDRIQAVLADTTILERLLGTGDLTVESAGERGLQVFRDIARPTAVQQEIDRQAERYRQRRYSNGAPAAEPTTRPSTVSELERLGALFDRQVLTRPEFEDLKAAILNRASASGERTDR